MKSRPIGDVVEDGRDLVELGAQLVEVGDLEVGAVADAARLRRQLAQQQAQQRRLARAVRTDDAELVAAHDRRREVARRPGSAAISEADVLRLDHQLPERSASWSCMRSAPGCSRRRGAAPRIRSSARTRPSLRVRRASMPWRIHASSWASFLSNSVCLRRLRPPGPPACARRRCRSRTPNRSGGRGRSR